MSKDDELGRGQLRWAKISGVVGIVALVIAGLQLFDPPNPSGVAPSAPASAQPSSSTSTVVTTQRAPASRQPAAPKEIAARLTSRGIPLGEDFTDPNARSGGADITYRDNSVYAAGSISELGIWPDANPPRSPEECRTAAATNRIDSYDKFPAEAGTAFCFVVSDSVEYFEVTGPGDGDSVPVRFILWENV